MPADTAAIDGRSPVMMRRWISALAAASLLCSASGCFGSFGLTRKVYRFNDDVNDEKWVQEAVYVPLTVPVYVTAALLDTIFFNSVEFWTGDTLIPVEPSTAALAEPAPAPAQKTQKAPAQKPAAAQKAPAPKARAK
jgi:hypothetical protein